MSAGSSVVRRLTRLQSAGNVLRQKLRVGESRGHAVDLYHELHGTGKHKVLFITGWAGSCENWRFQTDFFGRHGDFEVCIYENRGSGYSSSPPNKYRMVDMAKDAEELVSHLGWDKCHVVGVSMGGMIAQELALLLPERLSSLCLASTHAGRGLPPSEHIPRLMSIFALVSLGLAEVKYHVPKLLYSNKWLQNSAPIGSGCATNFEYMLKFHCGRVDNRPPQDFRAAMAQLWGIIRHHVSSERLAQLRGALSKLSVPAMVVHGTEDCLVHARNAYSLAKQIGAPLVLFDGRGHSMNHEDIQTFNALLLRHFYTAISGEREKAAVLSGWASLRKAFDTQAARLSDRLLKILSDGEKQALIEYGAAPSNSAVPAIEIVPPIMPSALPSTFSFSSPDISESQSAASGLIDEAADNSNSNKKH